MTMTRNEQLLIEELTMEIKKLREEVNVLKHLLHRVTYSAVEVKNALEAERK